jgi:hypothetical protein
VYLYIDLNGLGGGDVASPTVRCVDLISWYFAVRMRVVVVSLVLIKNARKWRVQYTLRLYFYLLLHATDYIYNIAMSPF